MSTQSIPIFFALVGVKLFKFYIAVHFFKCQANKEEETAH